MFFRVRRSILNQLLIILIFKGTMFVIVILYARSWTQSPHTKTDIVPLRIINYSLETMEKHQLIVKNFFEVRKDWVTSNLGTYLFKHGIRPDHITLNQNFHRVFNVLIWKHWPRLQSTHLRGFVEHGNNPLYGCSVSNCRFSGDTDISSADAVVIHIQKGIIPKVIKMNPRQLWIFWIDESPIFKFSWTLEPPSYEEFSNIFNWAMTYRTESEIPIPYGRTLPLLLPKTPYLRWDSRDDNFTIKILEELVPYWKDKRKNALAAILTSHCVDARMLFLMNLKKHLNIDIYGRCADDAYQSRRCPGNSHNDCKILSRYLFYLVIENSSCQQYITEKSFYYAYGKGAIPVFVGPFLEDCKSLLPPNSFLHMENFKTLEHLATEIVAISKNITKLLSYHTWRNHFKVVDEHGYFGTLGAHLCRMCEALNYNNRSQELYTASDIRSILDPRIQCI